MLGRRPDPDSPNPSPDGSSRSISDLLQGLQEYLAARAELLGLESAEAAQYAKRQLKLGIILGSAALFGYALLLVALTGLLGTALASVLPDNLSPLGWPLVALALGAIHLLVALSTLRKIKVPPNQPLFELTRSEFQKDRQWLKDQQKNDAN